MSSSFYNCVLIDMIKQSKRKSTYFLKYTVDNVQQFFWIINYFWYSSFKDIIKGMETWGNWHSLPTKLIWFVLRNKSI